MNRKFGLVFIFLAMVFTGCDINTPSLPVPSPKLLQKIKQESNKPNTQSTKYAVLINGSHTSRFMSDLSVAYQILLETGFHREHIYIFDSKSEDNNYLYPIYGKATKPNVKVFFEHLRQKISNQDILFVYVTDHGDRISRKSKKNNPMKLSTINLVDSKLNQNEFAAYLNGLNPKIGIFLFEQCYSGGFAEELGKNNLIAIASTKAKSVSYSSINDSFGGQFLLAFRNKNLSDANKDGRIDLKEAFEYAKKTHSFTKEKRQEPFIQSKIDPTKVFLE